MLALYHYHQNHYHTTLLCRVSTLLILKTTGRYYRYHYFVLFRLVYWVEQPNEKNTLVDEVYWVEQSDKVNTLIDEIDEEYSFWLPHRDKEYLVDSFHASTKEETTRRFDESFRWHPTRHFECRIQKLWW